MLSNFTMQAQASSAAYVRALFEPVDYVAVLAVSRGVAKGPAVLQRIVEAGRVAGERYQAWLRHLNSQGYDLFLGVNPVDPARGRRKKQDVAEVRRLQLDLDADGANSLRRILEDVELARIAAPAVVVRSSRHNYQVLWHTTPGAWTPEQAEETMGRLADRYAGDHSVVDVARVMRFPGFRNKKPGRKDALTTWTDYGGGPVAPASFGHLPAGDVQVRPKPRPAGRRAAARNGITQSERDWAFVRDRLRRGADQGSLVAILEQRRQDKFNPADYAARTVRKAAESLSLDSQPPR